jgi:hypothetical protein
LITVLAFFLFDGSFNIIPLFSSAYEHFLLNLVFNGIYFYLIIFKFKLNYYFSAGTGV